MEPLELAGLIASRMAHDFAGPVSAMENGAALLADETDPEVRAEFTTMLGEAAAKLAARLRLFRLAFGSGNTAERVGAEEARGALSGLLDPDGRVALDWRGGSDILTRSEVRLVLALAVLGAEALPRGGTLSVAQIGGGWVIEAIGARAAMSPDVLAVLSGHPGTEAGSRVAVAHFARAVADDSGCAITATRAEDRVALATRAV